MDLILFAGGFWAFSFVCALAIRFVSQAWREPGMRPGLVVWVGSVLVFTANLIWEAL